MYLPRLYDLAERAYRVRCWNPLIVGIAFIAAFPGLC